MPDLIDVVLTPRSRQLVLAATLMHPERWWFVRDLARHTGIAPSNAHKELRALALAGVLERQAEGKHVYYRANRACPLYHELRSIVRKTIGLVAVLQEALQRVAAKVRVAFVYGSVARGEETAESDVDLMLVGKAKLSEIAVAVRPAQQELLRAVNPTVFSEAEFAKKVAEKNHFITSVMAAEKLFVMGTADDLEATAR